MGGDGDGGQTQIERWLREGSTALELRVAASFGARVGPTQVSHAKLYLDAESETVRETDVVATAIGDHAALTAVVECKAMDAHPWVVLTDERASEAHADSFKESLRVRRGKGAREAKDYDLLGHRLLYPLATRMGYSTTIAAVPKKDDRRDDRNLAWDAVRQVVDAVRGLGDYRRGRDVGRLIEWFVPIVAITAPLFSVYLDDHSGQPRYEPVERAPMLAQVPLGGWGPGRPARMGTAAVWIVNASGIDEIADELNQTAAAIREPPAATT